MSRKKGFKVKRSRRNLYKKRKSTGRKIFDGVLFVVILGAFVFVGYSVASPLIKFFGGNGDNSSVSEPAWTPPESLPETSDSNSQTNSSDSSGGSDTTKDNTSSAPNEVTSAFATVAPDSALKSDSALNKFLASAKDSVYNAAVFTLKNTTGELLYKSSLKAVKDTDYNKPELARQYMEAAVAELCDENGNIKGIEAGKVDYLPVGTFEVDAKLPVTVIYVGTDDENEIVMAQLMKTMVEEAIGTDLIDFQIVCFSGWTYGTVADPYNYDIYFDSLSTGYADPSGILTRMTTDGAENVGGYDVPEYDALIDQALNAATFEERLEKFAEAEAYLCNGAYVIPFISSLRGYYMTNCMPFTSPLTLYGNSKFKGALVMDNPLTYSEYQTLDAAYEIARTDALKNAD